MLTIRDHQNNEYPLLAVKRHTADKDGNDQLELTIHQQKNNDLDLQVIDKLWEVDFNNITYKILYIKKQTIGDSFYLTVNAKPIFYWEFEKSIIHENHDGSSTANNAFSILFSGTGYNFVLVDFSPSVELSGFGKGANRLEIFKNLLDRYNYEFTIQGKTVYMRHLIGNDTNFVYKYKLNASNVSSSTDASEMFTHIKGFGDFESGEEDYLENAKLKRQYTSPLAEIIGTWEGSPIIDGRITQSDTMDERMVQAVENSLQISVEGDLHDVRSMGYEVAVPTPGDRVWLIDERIDLEQEIRLHQITTVYDERDNIVSCDVTFGSQSIRERHRSALTSLSQNFYDLITGKLKLPVISLEQIGMDMINAIHSASSEIVFGDFGMQAISKTNPNHIFGVNSEGWYISQDGGATPRTIATANGIYADALFAGTLWLTNEMNIESEDGYLNISGSRFFMQGKNSDQSVEISPDGLEINGGAIQINGGLPDNQIENAGKWNGQGTYIDEEGVYTGTLTANQITSGRIDSERIQIGPDTAFEDGYDPTEIEVGARNLIPHTDFRTYEGQIDQWRNHTSSATIWSATQEQKYMLFRNSNINSTGTAIVGVRSPTLTNNIVEGREYILRFHAATGAGVPDPFNYVFVMDIDSIHGSNHQINYSRKITPNYEILRGNEFTDLYEYTFTARWTGAADLLIGSTNTDRSEYANHWMSEPVLVEGNKAPKDWTPAPEDAKELINASDDKVRQDLRLEAPLPTSIRMDNTGITARTSNSNNLARLDHRGLYVQGGAIQINAADGRNVIFDGYMRAARVSNINFFNAGAFNGESDIVFNGMNWIWNDGNEHRIHYIDDEYKGRYMDFVVGVGLVTGSNPGNASVTIRIVTPNDTVAGSATYVVTATNWNLERKTIRVDLQALYNSIPDYRTVFLYMQVQVTSGTGARAAFRVNRGEFND